MLRMCGEVLEWEEKKIVITKVFRISKTTYDCLTEHGPHNAMLLFKENEHHFISVPALEIAGEWDGWRVMGEGFNSAGIDPDEFDL